MDDSNSPRNSNSPRKQQSPQSPVSVNARAVRSASQNMVCTLRSRGIERTPEQIEEWAIAWMSRVYDFWTLPELRKFIATCTYGNGLRATLEYAFFQPVAMPDDSDPDNDSINVRIAE